MTDVHREAPMTGTQDNAPQNTATASYTANSNYDLDNRIDTSSPFVNANEIRAYVSSDLLQQASFKSVKIKHTDSLNDGSFTSRSRAPKRRGAVSGRSTNTVLSEDGAFLTEVVGTFDGDVAISKAVLTVDRRTVDEKVKDACGVLNYPKGLSPVRGQGGNISKSDIDQRLQGMPGGLAMNKNDTKKYFGAESRTMFFERYQWMHNQRNIASVDGDHVLDHLVFDGDTVGGNINSDHNIKNGIGADIVLAAKSAGGGGEARLDPLTADIPFYPTRTKSSVSCATKVIIRTQSLDGGADTFSQIKLIPKPAAHSMEPLPEVYAKGSQEEEQPREIDNVDDCDTASECSDLTTGRHSVDDEEIGQPVMQPAVGEDQSAALVMSPLVRTDSATYEEMCRENIRNTVQQILDRHSSLLQIASPIGKSKPFSLLDPITPRDADSIGTHSTQKSKDSDRRNSKLNSRLLDGTPVKAGKGAILRSNTTISGLTASTRDSVASEATAQTAVASQRTKTQVAQVKNTVNGMLKSRAKLLAPITRNRNSSQNNSGNSSRNGSRRSSVTNKAGDKSAAVVDVEPAVPQPVALEPINTELLRSPVKAPAPAPQSLGSDQRRRQHSIYHHRKQPDKPDTLEFICIDHRDGHNRKIRRPLKQPVQSNTSAVPKGSLFEYVDSKKAHYDFNKAKLNTDNDESESDNSDIEELLSLNIKDANKDVNNSEAPPSTDLSPRSQYIDSCIRKRLNPRASLILRKNFTKQLSLQHHGIGDEMMCLFAEAIVNIPYIISLNIADNNLTDRGLGPIVKAIVSMKDLIDLNLSYNTIGPTAASCLSEYLASESCPLERLVLRRADVDDGECERFVTSLKTNRALTELDLSENLVGTSENLNSVMPDTVTGGEALADLLRSDGCVLSTLKLGWNMIRLDGAADLCNSLKTNSTLTYLDLSFNSLGSIGGIALGDALQDNKTLKSLYVSNNSIDSVACLTICAGILENEALQFVAFDGNPIGEEGAKALMLLPTMVGSRVKLSATSCNIGIRDPKCWFDSASLLRKFELKLDDPFDRAVGLIILYLIAAHQTFFIAHSEWYNDEDKSTTMLNLSEHVLIDFENKRLDKAQLQVIESLQVVRAAASNITKALELFHEIDEDDSGQLDVNEFGYLMRCMGMEEMNQEKVAEIMAEYDVDNGGFIELPEFLLFLKNCLKETNIRLKELTQFPVIATGGNTDDNNPPVKRVRYVPPRNGILRLAVLDGFTQKPTYRVINSSDREYIMDVARQSGELITMTGYGVQSYKIRLNEALAMVEGLLKESNSKTQILAKVLPQVATPFDCRQLVSKVLGGNKGEIARLKREIGAALRPMLGSCDGFYILDLSNKMDKFCLNRLLEISMTVSFVRGKKRDKLGFQVLGDCSQNGNWSCFRNEMFNGRPVVVNTDFATPMKRSGRLEFDFVSERRPEKDSFVLNDVRFTNLLIRHHMLNSDERHDALSRLRQSKGESDKTLNGDAKTVYEVPVARAAEIGEAMAVFYDNLALRYEQIERYRQKESIKLQMQYDPAKLALNHQTYHNIYKIPTMHVPKLYLIQPVRKESRSARQIARMAGGSFSMQSSPASTPGTGLKRGQSTRGLDTARSGKSRAGSMMVPDNVAEKPPGSAVSNTEDERSDDNTSKADALGDALKRARSAYLEAFDISSNPDSDNDSDEAGSSFSRPTSTQIGANNNNQPSSPGLACQFVNRQLEEPLDEYTNRYICTMASNNVDVQAKAVRQLELIVDLFEYNYFYARHVELLLDLFRDVGGTKNSDHFGTYRVELVVTLFACVVDLHNFEIVLRALTPFEAACVICRIGWLHIYNPMKPEGAYELDLSRREERVIVKTLAQLATAEPGDNLPEVSFRWERDMDSMPGYELTEPWLTEDGLPRKGIWNVVYYSGEGSLKKGCKPIVKLRKSMMQLVFISEEDVVNEADRDSDTPPPCVGEAFMMANIGMWYGYLAYNEEEYKAMKNKKASDAAAAAKAAKKRK